VQLTSAGYDRVDVEAARKKVARRVQGAPFWVVPELRS